MCEPCKLEHDHGSLAEVVHALFARLIHAESRLDLLANEGKTDQIPSVHRPYVSNKEQSR